MDATGPTPAARTDFLSPKVSAVILGALLIAAVAIAIFIAPRGPATVAIVFRETGLPPGRAWSVTVGNTTAPGSNDTVVVGVPPGTYAFRVSLANGTDYLPYPASGRIAVNASGATVAVTFVRSAANVTLTETGLPGGVVWWISDAARYYHSNTTSLTVTEPDGDYTLRMIVAGEATTPFWKNNTYVEDDLYAPNVSRLNLTVNGSDLVVPVHFVPLIQITLTFFPIPVFANNTGLGAPAYDFLEATVYRYTAANYSFFGLQTTPPANLTAYLMTPAEFGGFLATGNATAYVMASGNVSAGFWNLTFDSGTWYLVLTGWSIDEYRSSSFGFLFTFPGSEIYFS